MANDPLTRFLDLEDSFQRFPGRRPGGSGLTGIGTNRSRLGLPGLIGPTPRRTLREYDQLIQDQIEFEGLRTGKPINTRFGKVDNQQPPSLRSLFNKSAFGLPARITRRDIEEAEDKFRV